MPAPTRVEINIALATSPSPGPSPSHSPSHKPIATAQGTFISGKHKKVMKGSCLLRLEVDFGKPVLSPSFL